MVDFIADHFKRLLLFTRQMAVKPKEIFLTVDIGFRGSVNQIVNCGRSSPWLPYISKRRSWVI
jgi:hypothetical protein